MPDPAPDTRATVEPVTAEEIERLDVLAQKAIAARRYMGDECTDEESRASWNTSEEFSFAANPELIRRLIAAIRDRDAGWAAADALAEVVKTYAEVIDVQRGSYTWNQPMKDALAAYTAARAARGNTDAGKQVVGVHYNPNPDNKT